MYGIFPFLSEAYICGRLQSKSECRMEAIFLEGLFVEQIGAVVDRTVPRPPPTIPRCFAIFLQHLQCFHNIFTMWCKKIHSEVPFQGHQHSSPPPLFCLLVKRNYTQDPIFPCAANFPFNFCKFKN